jgi:hypothetical protein
MKVTLESTERIVEIKEAVSGGLIPARVWEGATEGGIQVVALVTRIAPAVENPSPEVCAEFERDLRACRPPSAVVSDMFPIPMRLIL